MNSTILMHVFFICLSFNFLQASQNKKSVAEIAQELIEATEKLRAVQAGIKKVKYCEDEGWGGGSDINQDEPEKCKKFVHGKYLKTLKQYEAAVQQSDDYLKSESVIELQKKLMQSLQERLENIEY